MQRPARLSATFVRTVQEPGRYGDGRGGWGLSLFVGPTANGRISKTWAQRLRLDGRPFNVGLGVYPIVTLNEARQAAIDNVRAVRAGVDVLADRKRRAAVPTFAEAGEKVIEFHVPTWKDGSRTAAIWRSRLAEHAHPVIGRTRVDRVTSADVLDVLMPVWATRRETARKLRQYISAVMAWAVVQGYRDNNPAAGEAIAAALPKGGAPRVHQRALPYANVRDALDSVRQSEAYEVTKLAVEFLTLTACRSGEVRGARWDEVGRDAATWTVPATRMKNGREHRVPLSAAALAVLDRAREYADPSGLVFPSVMGKVLSDSTLSKLFRDLGIAGTPHGMRSTFRTWAAECSDAPREICELALAHVEGSAAELAYRRTDYFEKRRALMAAWACAMG